MDIAGVGARSGRCGHGNAGEGDGRDENSVEEHFEGDLLWFGGQWDMIWNMFVCYVCVLVYF